MGKYEGFIKFQEYTRSLERQIELLKTEKEKLLKENHNLKVQHYLNRGCCGCRYEMLTELNEHCAKCGRIKPDMYEEDI